ncbi:DUF5634 family protein [Paraliobacillus ryukyuensis]|uniref:DUF5634 family protein n=1 Tax=Paraliobacillus ryukyuensis TaxID=200904 RepID=UPI0009A5C502|nr:DUF5634 family protein [Paraliobacillus ryukyuensis]
MELIKKQAVIDELRSKLELWKNACGVAHIDVYQHYQNGDLCYLGFQLSKQTRNFQIYLPYLIYDEEQLMPLTPIWTIEQSDNPIKKGFENVEQVISSILIAS